MTDTDKELPCHCLRCDAEAWETMPEKLGLDRLSPQARRMYLCPECGNKRCPRSDDHRNACTNSNEPGQPGSRYPAAIGRTM